MCCINYPKLCMSKVTTCMNPINLTSIPERESHSMQHCFMSTCIITQLFDEATVLGTVLN